jgi:hypothetical protein
MSLYPPMPIAVSRKHYWLGERADLLHQPHLVELGAQFGHPARGDSHDRERAGVDRLARRRVVPEAPIVDPRQPESDRGAVPLRDHLLDLVRQIGDRRVEAGGERLVAFQVHRRKPAR